MQPKIVGGKIALERELGKLDDFVLDFVSMLDSCGIKYVLVSGYVAIVFGRSRATEAIGILIEKADGEKFSCLWKKACEHLECMNAFSEKEALEEFLRQGLSIRFSQKGNWIPNMELKFVKTAFDESSLGNRLELQLSGNRLYISPLEQQIGYKLYLGSDQDFGDALHLYRLFGSQLDKRLLLRVLMQFKVNKKLVGRLDETLVEANG